MADALKSVGKRTPRLNGPDIVTGRIHYADDVQLPGMLYGRILREIERPLLTISLSATGGNQLQTAKMLGLNRNTLRKKIRDLNIRVMRGIKLDFSNDA